MTVGGQLTAGGLRLYLLIFGSGQVWRALRRRVSPPRAADGFTSRLLSRGCAARAAAEAHIGAWRGDCAQLLELTLARGAAIARSG